jgi:tetratricopeptide (TPR) repeat protein
MEKFFSSLALTLMMATILSTGCRMRGQDDKGDIFNEGPFAGVSDSINRFPNQADLYLRRAELLTQNNKQDLAFADFKKSWELHPTERTGLEYNSNLSITGNAPGAVALLRDCISRYPGNVEFKRLLSDAYVSGGRQKEAIAVFDNILKNDSSDADAWYERGRLLEHAHDTPAAHISLAKAYGMEPTITYTLELANLDAESNNAAALKLCNEVILKDSARELTDPYFIKGIYYANTKQYDAAIVQFDSCIARDWKLTDAYIEKGIAFFKEKNYDNAMNTFRTAASVSFNYPDAYFWMGRCYEAINKKAEAAEYYQKAILLDRDFTEAKEALKRVS